MINKQRNCLSCLLDSVLIRPKVRQTTIDSWERAHFSFHRAMSTNPSTRRILIVPSSPMTSGRLRLKCDGIRAETRFRRSAKRTSSLNRRGRQFSRLLAAEVCASAVVILDTLCSEILSRVLATHSISLSLPLPCVTVCIHISTGLYEG